MKRVLYIMGCIVTLLLIAGVVHVEGICMIAHAQVTTQIDLSNGDTSGEKYSYNSYAKELTLDDGFSINVNNANAIVSNQDLTIILKGEAAITSNNSGIVTGGAVTVRSYADEMTGNITKDGHMTITSGAGDSYYGIYTGDNGGNIEVCDNAVLEVNANRYSVGRGGSGTSYLKVGSKGVVKLRSTNTGLVKGYQISNSATESVIVVDNNNPVFKNTTGNTSVGTSSNSLDLFTFSISGYSDNFVYDGKQHTKLVANASITPSLSYDTGDFYYNETTGSEYINSGEDYDYRDKAITSTKISYKVDALSGTTLAGPVNAGVYNIKYGNYTVKNGTNNLQVTIIPRKVTITGLKVKTARKLYDGWNVADVDFSDMVIDCVNGDDNGTGSLRGIIKNDMNKLKTDIVPFAMAYYLDEDDTGDAYFIADEDQTKYIKSSDVSYKDDSVMPEVDTKAVLITDISLSDPNYQVVTSAESDAAPNYKGEGAIYPRDVNDESVTHTLTPPSYPYKDDGFLESEITKVVKDSSNQTKGGHGIVMELVENKDYIVNPNDNRVKNIGEHIITITGQGNYMDSRSLVWEIKKARRAINIVESATVKKCYDGQAYSIDSGAGEGSSFYYTVNNTDYADADMTTNAESINPTIVYSGINGTDYPESSKAPVNAGKYRVKVSLAESDHYAAAEGIFDFEIYKKTVSLEWHVSGANVNVDGADPLNPNALIYNGTANVFTAVVTNKIGTDAVEVTEITYTGKNTTVYPESNDVPAGAGDYTVKAKGVDNDNYTVDSTAAYAYTGTERIEHSYTIAPKELTITWADSGSQFTYDKKKHGLTPVFTGLCANENDVEDTVAITNLDYGESRDVMGNPYTYANGTVNASDGEIHVKATALDNSNYTISDESTEGVFTINKRNLSKMTAGTYKDKKDIWAEKSTYNGKVQRPVIKWALKEGEETTEVLLAENTDYTATGSKQALEYSATGLTVNIEGINNYEGTNSISWNVEKIDTASIEVSYDSLLEEGETEYKVHVGYMPENPVITSWSNTEISNNINDDVNNHISYHYTGKLSNGEEYDSDEKPLKVGKYTVTVTLEATAHFDKAQDTAEFSIVADEITVSGIKANDKIYDGTTDVSLDFSEAVFEGVALADISDYRSAFEEALSKKKIQCEAAFDAADVKVENGEASPRTVNITKLGVEYDSTTPDVLCNYVISYEASQHTTSAVINKKPVVISNVLVNDKPYDGNTKAQADTSKMTITGCVEGEKLGATVTAEFEDKNVAVSAATGEPKAKNVNVDYELTASNAGTKVSNYLVDKSASMMTDTAVISPIELNVVNFKAKSREYDGSKTAELDWSVAELSGVVAGDDVIISEDNADEYPFDDYADSEVLYDESGNIIEKSGTVTEAEHKIILAGNYANNNYYVKEASYTGLVTQKKLKGVDWSISKTLKAVPKAAYGNNSGLVAGAECSPVIEFYDKQDAGFETAVSEDELTDHGSYTAKVVGVTDDNYSIDENDATLVFDFTYNVTKYSSNLKITNYMSESGQALSLVYGNELPKPSFSYDNDDIAGLPDNKKEEYITVNYSGKTLSGDDYDSVKAPTEAGNYKITAQLKETELFAGSNAVKEFSIRQRPVVISSGITANDKMYDGNSSAVLNFDNVVVEGLLKDDMNEAESWLKAKGNIDYTAAFKQKDVLLVRGEVADVAVDISSLKFKYDEKTPKCMFNYSIASDGNQSELYAKIHPRSVVISGVRAKDKVYDAKADADTDVSGLTIEGAVGKEKLGVVAKAQFLDKNVALDQETGNPTEKTVNIAYTLFAGDDDTNASNYYINEADSVMSVNAVITPAKLTIMELKALPKEYDKTSDAVLDWNEAIVVGAMPGDNITISQDNADKYPADKYDDADVSYNKLGEVTDKSGVITNDEYKVLLAGGNANSNYYVEDIEYTGVINPKSIKGVEWTFNEKGVGQLPAASYAGDSGVIDNDACEAVVQFFKKDDKNFNKAVDAELLIDREEYVAKVVNVSSGNYCIDDEDDSTTLSFLYRGSKDASNLKITNYQKTGNEAFTVTYGDVLPSPEIEYTNDDFDSSDEDRYVTYRYTGKTLNGKEYDDKSAPKDAGDYILTVSVKETDHYKGSKAQAAFTIAPKTIVIKSGVTALDKKYDGTDKAELEFGKALVEGLLEEDKDLIMKGFSDGNAVKYTARFDRKDVLLTDGKETAMAVNVSGLKINYGESAPESIWNYVLSGEGNQSEFSARILRRPVTVSGIKVKDKVYDGSEKAVLDLFGFKLDGSAKGESLTVDVDGVYVKTGNEESAKDVLTNADGKAADKKVIVTISKLKSGNNKTITDNYYFADSARKLELKAIIKPCELNSVEWSFDENTNMPKAAFTEGVLKGESPEVLMNVYSKSDKTYTKAIAVSDMTAGDVYVARVEGVSDTNYTVAASFKNPIYTFAYGVKVEIPAEPTVSEKNDALLKLRAGLSLSAENSVLTFKWGEVKGADGYLVYTGVTGSKYGKAVTVNDGCTYTFNISDESKVYKAYVKAYKLIDGKKYILAKSYGLRYAGAKKDGYNATSVKAKKNLKIKVKSTKIIGAYVYVSRNKKSVKKTGKKAYLKYWSTNTKIATVSSSGKVKGVKKGKCYIYAMARNGIKKKIKITVY